MSTTLLAPPVDDATRRQFLGLLAAAGLLTACGSDDSAPAGDAAPATRSVDHTFGSTEVPVEPQWVVSLENTVVPGLIALGLTPIAAANGVDAFLVDQAELLPGDVAIPGTASTEDGVPDIEALAVLQPDLIVGTDVDVESYDRLRAIAPTVLVPYGENGDWRARLLAVAEAVNRSAASAELEAAYEQVIAGLPEEVRSTTVAFIRPDSDGQFRIDSGVEGFADSVATDAAIPVLTAPEDAGGVDEGSFVTVSGERLDVIGEAGLIVVPNFASEGDEQDGITQFEANPLWAALPAVQAGRVLQLPGLVYNGGSHYAAELLLRGLSQALS